MKSKLKITVLFILTVVLLICALTGCSIKKFIEWREKANKGSLEYVLNSDCESYAVTGIGTFTGAYVVIPSKYKNKPVTEIATRAFEKCDKIVSVEIPDSVKSIGDEAFAECTSLSYVELCDSVTSIGDYAFKGCRELLAMSDTFSLTEEYRRAIYEYFVECFNLQDTDFDDFNEIYFALSYGYSSVKIPNGITSIGHGVFSECSKIMHVIIPDSVKNIGNDAFGKCRALMGLEIPNGVTSIGNDAFSECCSLMSIKIPDSVTTIGCDAFSKCTALRKVHIKDMTKWCSIAFDNDYANPLYYAEQLYLNGELVTNPIIPDGIESIGQYAFCQYNALTMLVIPDSVDCIGTQAFYNCACLTSINYGGTVSEWNNITKWNDWDKNTGEFTVYCTDGTVAKDGTVTYFD